MKRKRHALCGLSTRALGMFVEPLLGLDEEVDLTSENELVAILDPDRERVELFKQCRGLTVPVFDKMEAMLEAVNPDSVIVAGPDSTHAEQVVSALRGGCEVIAEKPLATDFGQIASIRNALQETDKRLRMGFNFRYAPLHKMIKGLLQKDRIGRVTTLELNYCLDTYHGSSYFHRWNRHYRDSGGLAVSKSCHHFDLINWWLEDTPASLVAEGDRFYFGPDSPHKPGPGERCPYEARWADEAKDDPHGLWGDSDALPNTWQYPKDRPWTIYDEDIDVEDAYSTLIRYNKGAIASYTCHFSTPWEGYRLAINGTHGRIDAFFAIESARCPFPCPEPIQLFLTPLFGDRQTVEVPLSDGSGHGGADRQLLRSLFGNSGAEDSSLDLEAGADAGLLAAGMGIAVGVSIRENRKFAFDQLSEG